MSRTATGQAQVVRALHITAAGSTCSTQANLLLVKTLQAFARLRSAPAENLRPVQRRLRCSFGTVLSIAAGCLEVGEKDFRKDH